MYILGLNTYHADSFAAILKDGELIAAIEKSGFTRMTWLLNYIGATGWKS